MATAIDSYLLLVAGRDAPAASGETFTVYEPATGRPLADVAKGGPADVEEAIEAAHRSFDDGRGAWPRGSTRERAAVLFRVARLIRERAEQLAVLESRNAGKAIRDARDEVEGAALCFEFYAGAITTFGGQTLPAAAPGLDLTLREPVGPCTLITPWNFPLAIASWKLAPALAAGNSVILKPASYTPLTALALGALCREAGVPDGVVSVLTWPGASVGRALAGDPRIAKVSFTGETATGQEILRAAAANIARVSLELGGKSPNVVFDDADVEAAARSPPLSVFANAGQDCCARSGILVHERVQEQFLEHFVAVTKALRVGDPLDPETEVGSLISPQRRDRVEGFLRAGEADGAEILCGGTRPQRPGSFLLPAVVDRVGTDSRLVRQEIFGPVATVLTFRTEEEAIRLANDTDFGLSGSLWTRDVGRALRVSRAMRTGVLSVNCHRSVHLEAPFGGYKRSGLGRELGEQALEHYTELKNVFFDQT